MHRYYWRRSTCEPKVLPFLQRHSLPKITWGLGPTSAGLIIYRYLALTVDQSQIQRNYHLGLVCRSSSLLDKAPVVAPTPGYRPIEPYLQSHQQLLCYPEQNRDVSNPWRQPMAAMRGTVLVLGKFAPLISGCFGQGCGRLCPRLRESIEWFGSRFQ